MTLQGIKSWFARVGTTAAVGTICGILGGLGGYAAISYAAEISSDTDGYYIPYQGQIDLGGMPVDGPTNFTFALYGQPSGGSALWTSSARELQVSDGYFAVVLGDQSVEPAEAAISSSIMARDALYVGITVEGVELEGRQRLLGVPYAQNAFPGKRFVVDSQIRGMNGANIDGTTTLETVEINGTTTVNGDLIAAGATDIHGTTTLFGAAQVNNKLTVEGVTTLNGWAHFSNNLTIDGTLDANGHVSFEESANFNDKVTIKGDKLDADLVRFTMYNTGRIRGPDDITRTKYLVTDWNCAIAGQYIGKGDIREAGSGTIFELYTFKRNGYWWIKHYFREDPGLANAPRRVGVVCFRKNISSISPDPFYTDPIKDWFVETMPYD